MKKLFLLPLIFFCFHSFAAKVDTIQVKSVAMKKFVYNVVVIPDSYEKKGKGKALPVLYLLHGAGGSYRDWIKNVPELKAFSDAYNLIIVCPDGGVTSWYFDSPIDSSMQYETYVATDLVHFIDAVYNTIKDKNGRAITGLSMGGHGALYLAFRHMDLFGAAGSTSGGVDFRPFPKNWDIAKRLGDYAGHTDVWDQNTVTNMIDSIKGKPFRLIFDCGVSDFFYTVNKTFHEKLLEAKVPHDYIERPGEHNWAYWSNSIKYQVLFFHEFFEGR